MTELNALEVERYVKARLPDLRKHGGEWRGPCPVHGGKRDSFAVNADTGQAFCHSECGQGWDLIGIEAALTGVDGKQARRELLSIVGRAESKNGSNGHGGPKEIERTYPYQDAAGRLLFEVVRFRPKDFRQRRPDGKGGWAWNLQGIEPVLFRLPKLKAADPGSPVLICEGERDVETAEKLGFLATCNPMGAGKWKDAYSSVLSSLSAVVIPDNDEPGRKHAIHVLDSLLRAGCRDVRVVELPGAKDLTEFIANGGDAMQISILAGIEKPLTQAGLQDLRIRWLGAPEETPGEGPEDAPDGPRGRTPSNGEHSQASRIVNLVEEMAELFSSPEGKPFATISFANHRETWPVRSSTFHDFVRHAYLRQHGRAPSGKNVTDAMNTIAGLAKHEGQRRPVYLRTAELDGAIYIDLGSPDWSAIEVTPEGWRVVPHPPVRFRRSRGMLPLPIPSRDGNGQDLIRRFFRLANDGDLLLLLSWVIAAVRPAGPYPILIFISEQGSGKSTLCRMIRSLTDPNEAPIRAQPRDERDLAIASDNSAMLALDNISHMPDWLSDALCRISTGGGYATRQLYTDGEEAIFNFQRPIMLNGIEELANRGDLMDRAILIELPAIPEELRQPEDRLWADFRAAQPAILGYLLTALSGALANLPHVTMARSPRMADFARLGVAAEAPLGWQDGDFLNAYEANRTTANNLALDASPVGRSIIAVASGIGPWSGTASVLLAELSKDATESEKRTPSFPKNARSLTNALRRLATNLRSAGVLVEFDRDTGRKRDRLIRLSMTE